MLHPVMRLAACCAVLALAACESTQEAETEPTTQAAMNVLNTRCPISNQPVSDDIEAASYGGHAIGFCCNACPDRWRRMTDDEKDAYIATVTR